MSRVVFSLSVCLCLSAASGLRTAEPVATPPIKLVPRPIVNESDRRARSQPTVPETYEELPFVETAPDPTVEPAEEARGYILFRRPITEPVHPNTRPLDQERLSGLVAFAARGEFEPVTFSVYPLRDLEDFRVRVSALSGPGGQIEASQITVRLATHWNVGYPRYTSRSTYRRVPELLERVTVHSCPARECQRWWIRILVPESAKPGLYRGTVTVWDDGFDGAVEIPLALRVLGFKLKADPAKHYSAYYYVRNQVQLGGKDETFVKKATGNEYRAMVEYGLDMLPTMYLHTDGRVEKISVRHAEELDRMLRAGMRGPLPLAGGNAIERIYKATTPGGKRGSHWRIDKMPPPEFYERVTAMFRDFEADRRARGWPEVVCCPLDEVAASHKEFGSRVYKAVRDAGVRTYATKNSLAADAEPYRPHVDVWCSQPYSVPYDKIFAQERYEYWCYPNHNAGEIKDRRVMCKGGRMTYGFGFWRSGYTTLIPWHWAWTPAPDQFDYLRGTRSGCGQRIDEDGEVIPSVYWECFREGRDDARYIYTLQQAVWERDGSPDPRCQLLVEAGKKLLQETWDSIFVQQKYLAEDMWPADEFNARRWHLAMMIDALLDHAATRTTAAPSVLVAAGLPKPASATPSIVEMAAKQGILDSAELGGDFAAWRNATSEGSLEVTAAAGVGGIDGLRWQVKINHQLDGGEGGEHPVGWPRISRSFRERQLDMSAYDYLEFKVRFDSNRDEVSDDTTPLGLFIGSHEGSRRLFETSRDLGDRQRVWLPVRFSMKKMMEAAGVGSEPWKSVSRVQLFVAERSYQSGASLVFDVATVKLLRLTSPMIVRLEAPRFVMLPRRSLSIAFEVVGLGSVELGSHQVRARLIDERGKTCAQTQQDLAAGQLLVLDSSALTPGIHTLKVDIMTAAGKHCSELVGTIEGVPGPLLGTN